MTTAELMMAWPRLFESELAEPILSVMDGPVRARACYARCCACSARARRPGRAARIDAQCDRGCCCAVTACV